MATGPGTPTSMGRPGGAHLFPWQPAAGTPMVGGGLPHPSSELFPVTLPPSPGPPPFPWQPAPARVPAPSPHPHHVQDLPVPLGSRLGGGTVPLPLPQAAPSGAAVGCWRDPGPFWGLGQPRAWPHTPPPDPPHVPPQPGEVTPLGLWSPRDCPLPGAGDGGVRLQ